METELGYLYFVRTDGSMWQYCIESQEAKEMASPTDSDKKIGDINADDSFNVADLVMLQSFLVRRGDVTDWSTGDAVWVVPKLVCTVKYMMKTESGGLRQPVFEGLREDKVPEECRCI